MTVALGLCIGARFFDHSPHSNWYGLALRAESRFDCALAAIDLGQTAARVPFRPRQLGALSRLISPEQTSRAMGLSLNNDFMWRWGLLLLASLIFFVATGATFSSLVILLPGMIEEQGWSWAGAGAGFTLLALMTGLSSTLPATTLRLAGPRYGLRAAYASGGALIAAGFILIATSSSLLQYWIGACLVGTGYSQTGAVPGVHLSSTWFRDKGDRARAVGVFFTSGALGSVVAPLVARAYLDLDYGWRSYWWLVAGLVGIFSAVAAMTMRSGTVETAEEREHELEDLRERRSGQETTLEDGPAHPAEINWTLSQVLRNYQYYIIVASVTFTLLGAVTMNTVAGGHLQNNGVDESIIAFAISGHAVFNAMARAFGGLVGPYLEAKWLLVSGLVAGIVGMIALAVADNYFLLALFAFGDGYCFGMVVFASTVLLLNYFGSEHNPAILGTMNLITTVAMIGPVAAGWVGDATGSFQVVFIAIGALMILPTLAVVFMPRPLASKR